MFLIAYGSLFRLPAAGRTTAPSLSRFRMLLSDIIIERISNEGPISFHDFMEMALYYPESGYYMSDQDKLGITGDFYTSPCYTPLFGKMIARQLEEMWQLMDNPAFTIVEYGAGTGQLCMDILQALQSNKALYKQLSYHIIEKSKALREKQQQSLPGIVRWHDHITELPAFSGCILSNEVLDNFSVHQVVMQKELMEVFVSFEQGFAECLRPAAPALQNYLHDLQVQLPIGFRTEINLEAVQWIHDIAAKLQKGFVLTIDYGYPSVELYANCRRNGTLLCYHRHRINDYPYQHIGLQDITALVNFSALHHWGSRQGLELAGYTSQSYFLMGLGIGHACTHQQPYSPAMLRHFFVNMGSRFKILGQQKGIHKQLSGFRFCQPFA